MGQAVHMGARGRGCSFGGDFGLYSGGVLLKFASSFH